MSVTTNEKLAKLEAAKEKLDARIKAEKARVSAKQRKDDARRKVIVGAVVLAHAEHDGQFADLLWTILKNRTIREKDREFLGLPPLEKAKSKKAAE